MKICEYGCGEKANFSPRKGHLKYCCSGHFTKCPGMIEKMNKDKIGRTWEETLGKEKTNQRKKKQSKYLTINNPMKNSKPWNKGLRDCYTEETLQKMRCQKSHKGRTWEDIHGKEKADQRKIEQANQILKNMKGMIPWNKDKPQCFSNKTLKQMSSTQKKVWTEEKRKHQSIYFRKKLKDYQEKYPFFYSIEELRENNNQEVEVRCKYCNKWFVPTVTQIFERLRAIESKNGSMMSYMYCCKNHQYLCPCSIVKDPKLRTKYESYVKQVWNITNQNIKEYKIKNIKLRGLNHGYHLDHKYSISEGYTNKVDPKIIGHYKNLKVIKDILNISKGRNCSISLDKLKKEINEVLKYEN